jgi:hypothetical protein
MIFDNKYLRERQLKKLIDIVSFKIPEINLTPVALQEMEDAIETDCVPEGAIQVYRQFYLRMILPTPSYENPYGDICYIAWKVEPNLQGKFEYPVDDNNEPVTFDQLEIVERMSIGKWLEERITFAMAALPELHNVAPPTAKQLTDVIIKDV